MFFPLVVMTKLVLRDSVKNFRVLPLCLAGQSSIYMMFRDLVLLEANNSFADLFVDHINLENSERDDYIDTLSSNPHPRSSLQSWEQIEWVERAVPNLYISPC